MTKRERGGGGDGRDNNLSARKLQILEGDKSDGCGRNASVYHVYPVSRTTGEERAECSNGWGCGGDGIFNSFRSDRCRGLQYARC